MKPRLSVKEAAVIMGADPQFIRIALQRGKLPIGIAEKKSKRGVMYAYYISTYKLSEYTGIPLDAIERMLNGAKGVNIVKPRKTNASPALLQRENPLHLQPFSKLRGKLSENDIDQKYLAKKLGLSENTVSYRMTGRFPWTLEEMYSVMDLIREPHELLHEYFPKGGR